MDTREFCVSFFRAHGPLAEAASLPIVTRAVTGTIPQLKSLSLAKKRPLISGLLGEVFGEPVVEPDLADALAARVAHYRRNPDSGRTWAEVKARLRRGK